MLLLGCVPSKALLRPVLAVADAGRVDGAREAVMGAVAPAGAFGRRDLYVSDWDDTHRAAVARGALLPDRQ
jgi:pyruvate/2-oxoglutarate dehydrogenase complex dihydrolipoamide dehydrogenase (E3) component